MKYVAAEQAERGKRYAYTIRYKNVGDVSAKGAGLVGAIPEGMRFLTAVDLPAETQVLFSIDFAESFKAPPIRIKIVNTDGSESDRELGPDAYTHVRFVLSQSIEPGESGLVRYLVELK